MPLTISELMQKMPSTFLPEKARGVEATIHFQFTGAEAGEWNAVIKDAKCAVAPGSRSEQVTMSVTADSADFVKLFTGELDGMQAFMLGKLKLSGDLNLAMQMMQMFKI